MYQLKLKIQLYSKNNDLQDYVKSFLTTNLSEYSLETYTTSIADNFSADLILWDLPVTETLLVKMQESKARAVFVLMTEEPNAAVTLGGVAELFDDIWSKNTSKPMQDFYLQKILQSAKQKADLRLQKVSLNTMIDSVPSLIWFKDVRGSHLKVNDAFCKTVEKTKQQVEGRGHYYIWDIPQDEYEQGEYICLESEEIVMEKREVCVFDEKVKSKQGMRQFKTYKAPLIDEDGHLFGTVGIAHDVTDFANMSTELEILLNSMPFAILLCREDGTIIDANNAFEKYFNCQKQDVLLKKYTAWKQVVLRDKVTITESGHTEARIMNGNEERIIDIYERPIYDIFRNLTGYIFICRDVTIEKNLMRQILYNANTDLLTGLYNRRYFYEYIKKISDNNMINILYIDLDNFKQINDIYGHQAGDSALIKVAEILREHFPHDFIARIGGDEFLVAVLGTVEQDKLATQAELLLEKMQVQFVKDVQTQQLTASIGISSSKNHQFNIDDLIKESDIALYEVKRAGKAGYRIYSKTSKAE